VSGEQPIKVAIVGGGCAAIAAAFELSRPEHNGKYEITVYQLGWRLGGKGASGRGPANRIEEHGFHVWFGFYDNAFRLMRQCYTELNRDRSKCRIADWRDAFFPAPFVGLTDRVPDGSYRSWVSYFPPADGFPGDPFTEHNPFSVTSYLARTAAFIRTMLLAVDGLREQSSREPSASTGRPESREPGAGGMDGIAARIARILKMGMIATTAGLIEGLGLLEIAIANGPPGPGTAVRPLLETIAAGARRQLETLVDDEPSLLRLWQAVDLGLTTMLGIVRFGLVSDPKGFDAINEYDFREWMKLNGASQRTLDSTLVRAAYDLAMAYEDGDYERPRHAAGVALRGSLRLLFGYRGSAVWKMRAGMGDIVFAPFYEVLKRRGVSFRFFHRLANVGLVGPLRLAPGERPYVDALEFDVQAEVRDGAEYQPLVDIDGLPCWPSKPDYAQLVDGVRMQEESWNFESHFESRKAGSRTLRVTEDFDMVVLGVGLGAIPYVCRELVQRDPRWSEMVNRVRTVETQAFQLWMREDVETLGWTGPFISLSAFARPFDTWGDMRHLIEQENLPEKARAVAYFCSALTSLNGPGSSVEYAAERRDHVRRQAIEFLNRHIANLWPKAAREGKFRWELLVDPYAGGDFAKDASQADESAFDTQFWTANVDPTERYVLSVPGSQKYRISPLDNTYDNLTIAGDWTACGLDTGCVESAVMSGRLAAHAISSQPALEEIVGYDHP
jgi:uncharacterized protein with NAD-binding domain and iron-sulfur cluster